MAKLFEPLRIRSAELKNRIVVSPMCEYSSEDGFANDWHLVHLGSRAVGGASLVIAEATAVSPEGRITPDDLGIWKDDHIQYLSRITNFIKTQDSIPGIQLAHAGRKASHSSPWKGARPLLDSEGAWTTVAPSPIAYKDGDRIPQELTKDGILNVINDFQMAAQRSMKAGFEMIEIHAAHGYLLNEFLSPLSNTRTDEYGGTLNNRIKILIEIVDVVRQVIGHQKPLFVRISATDWTDEGWTIEDSVLLAKELKLREVDLIDCSSGGNVHGVKIPVQPMYQAHLAETVRKEAGILTGAVGLITTAGQAESILAKEMADIVLMARQLLRDPYFPLHAASDLGEDIPWPNQYLRAKK